MEKEVIILFVLLEANLLLVEFISLISELLKLTQNNDLIQFNLIRKSGYNIFDRLKRSRKKKHEVVWRGVNKNFIGPN